MNQIQLHGKTLVARELTVREVDQVLQELDSGEMHRFEFLFPEEPVSALSMAISLGIEKDNLLEFSHSQLGELIAEVKKHNPFLLKAVGDLAEIGRKILAAGHGNQPDPDQQLIDSEEMSAA